jgi:hypothetical protein
VFEGRGVMKLDRFGAGLALAANLGVIASLVLLAVELRQNTQVVRAQAVANLATGISSGEAAFMGEDAAEAFVKAVYTPETLTNEEIAKVWAYLNVTMMAAQQVQVMYASGLATEEAWKNAQTWASVSISFPFGRLWWREMKIVYLTDLVETIDAALVEWDPETMQSAFERMKNEVRAPSEK